MSLNQIIDQTFQQAASLSQGRPATYIPELAKVNGDLFSASVCDIRGEVQSCGDVNSKFTLQSISKVLAYSLVLDLYSEDEICERVGVEPSGEVFDSIIKLDKYQRPFNPMVNAGAIAITDLIISKFQDNAYEESIKYFSRLFGTDALQFNKAVYSSEMQSASRNRALAHLLKSFELLENPVEEVLELYFKHCSIEVDTATLSRFGGLLARKGRNLAGIEFISVPNLRNILSVMLSCGMYNYAGQWIYEVGLPAKSGVSGGILAIAPERFGIAVFSPRINEDGCSLRGAAFLKGLVNKLNLHVFDYNPVPS